MTKTYCDLCGKEIENPGITLTIDLGEEADESEGFVLPPIARERWKEFDVCADCKDRVMEFFKEEQEE